VLVDVSERYYMVEFAVVLTGQVLDDLGIGHVAADFVGEDAHTLVGVVLGEEGLDVVGVSVGDDHDHLVAVGAVLGGLVEELEGGGEWFGEFALAGGVELLKGFFEFEFVDARGLDELVGVGRVCVFE